MDEPPSTTIDEGAADEPATDSSADDSSEEFEVDQDELEECRQLCRRPMARAIHEDVLSLLNPRLWIGLARLRRLPLDGAARALGFLAVPPVLYAVTAFLIDAASPPLLGSRQRREATSTASVARSLPAPRSLLFPYALSPWSLYHAFWAFKPLFALTAQVFAFRTLFRSRVLDEAVVELGNRIRQNRAGRYPRYDLYLPPPKKVPSSLSPSSNDPESTYVLFVPGAGVAPISYARPAAMLSDAGMHVAVVNTEGTLRLSSHHVGYTTDFFRAIQLHAQSQSQRRRRNRQQHPHNEGQAESGSKDDGVRWVGVGHSMGCFTLSHLDWTALQIRKVAFWGISPLFVQDLADLSRGDNDVSVLIVRGSDDALDRMAATTNPDLERQFYAKLPDASTRRITTQFVEGGTHRGFASYESRLLPEPQRYEHRDRQQRRAVGLTAPFLLADG